MKPKWWERSACVRETASPWNNSPAMNPSTSSLAEVATIRCSIVSSVCQRCSRQQSSRLLCQRPGFACRRSSLGQESRYNSYRCSSAKPPAIEGQCLLCLTIKLFCSYFVHRALSPLLVRQPGVFETRVVLIQLTTHRTACVYCPDLCFCTPPQPCLLASLITEIAPLLELCGAGGSLLAPLHNHADMLYSALGAWYRSFQPTLVLLQALVFV